MTGTSRQDPKSCIEASCEPNTVGLADGSQSEVICGIHPVLEFLRKRPGCISEITVQESKGGPRLQEIIVLARKHNLKLRFAKTLRIPGLAKEVHHQGVAASIAAGPILSLDKLLARVRETPASPIILALDSIMDPHNLGAIIRSAAAAGATGIILTKDRSAPLSATVAKISAGTLAHVNICRVTNMKETLKRLKQEGFWVYGADSAAEQSIYETDFSGPACLVVGGEEKGIRPLIKKQCDVMVSIPIQRPVDSLNASVATAVILFEIVRSRKKFDR